MEGNKKQFKLRWYILGTLGLLVLAFFCWDIFKPVPTVGDWQTPLAVLSTAEFNGDLVTVKNVRNFQYDEAENVTKADYYDRTYDLNKIVKVWYLVEPFKGLKIAAHTFVSFEFSDGNFLSITIEARKLKGQEYNLFYGLFHTYPLMYIAADERDSVFVRTNIRKDDLYVYPVKLAKAENARLLLVDMLNKMNNLIVHPYWYNTLWANCTSNIVYHVNHVSQNRLPQVPWQAWLTGYADELAYKMGLLDVNSTLEEARKKYYVTKRSQEFGYVANYSQFIRQFPAD